MKKKITVTFLITLIISLISIAAGLIGGISLAFAGETILAMVLPIVGVVALVALTLLGQEKLGAAAVAVASYGGLIALVCGVYEHFYHEIANIMMSTDFDLFAVEGMLILIVVLAMFVVSAIVANVFAWIPYKKVK